MEVETSVMALCPGSDGWKDGAQISARDLRTVFGSFMTGVTVITTRDEAGELRGFTANSFTSVSLDPPLVLFCLSNRAGSFEAFSKASSFAINILADSQKAASEAFAGRAGRKFEAVDFEASENGPPVLKGTLSSLICVHHKVVEAGDHIVVIGRVVACRSDGGQPLGYYGGGYVCLGLAADALEQNNPEAIRLGCLLEHYDRVLLMRSNDQNAWRLPVIPLRSGQNHRETLPRFFEAFGIKADTSLLYSVFQEQGEHWTTMVFRGGIHSMPPEILNNSHPSLRLFFEYEQPWTLVRSKSEAQLIRRFFTERAGANFGI